MSPIALSTVMRMALVTLLSGCTAGTPPSRLNDYVGAHQTPALESLGPLSNKAGRTGLLVIADQTAAEAAPILPDEAQTQLHRTTEGTTRPLASHHSRGAYFR
jgi:hypothetical protein